MLAIGSAQASLIGDTVSSTHVLSVYNYEVDTVVVTADNSDLMWGGFASTNNYYTIDVNESSIYITTTAIGWQQNDGYHGFTIFDLDDSTGVGLSDIDVDTNIANWSLDRLLFNDDQIWVQLAGDGAERLGAGYLELSLNFSPEVPIPAALWLFGSGLGLLGWMRRKPA